MVKDLNGRWDGTFCAYVTNQIKHLFKMNYGNMTSSTVRITIPKIELEQTGDLVKQNNRNSKHKQARTKKKQQTTINKTKTSISICRQVTTKQQQTTIKQQQKLQTTTNNNRKTTNNKNQQKTTTKNKTQQKTTTNNNKRQKQTKKRNKQQTPKQRQAYACTGTYQCSVLRRCHPIAKKANIIQPAREARGPEGPAR